MRSFQDKIPKARPGNFHWEFMKIARNSLKHIHIRNSELLEKFIPTEAINLESIKNITLLVICFIWVLCIFMSYFFFCLFFFSFFYHKFFFLLVSPFSALFYIFKGKIQIKSGLPELEGRGGRCQCALFTFW